MGKTADAFKAHLDSEGIKYTYYEPTETRSEAVRIQFSGKNSDDIAVNFFFDKDGNTVNIKCFSIAKVPTDKLMDTYVALNELNAEYRWVKFFVDSDNEVTVSGDAIIEPMTTGAECGEILYRYVSIIDEVYPRIMKVIWA